MTEDLNDDFMQYLMDQLNKGYSEYKKNHPDFARVVEEEEHKLKGNYQRNRSHCRSCGEWLASQDICPECGKIQE